LNTFNLTKVQYDTTQTYVSIIQVIRFSTCQC